MNSKLYSPTEEPVKLVAAGVEIPGHTRKAWMVVVYVPARPAADRQRKVLNGRHEDDDPESRTFARATASGLQNMIFI